MKERVGGMRNNKSASKKEKAGGTESVTHKGYKLNRMTEPTTTNFRVKMISSQA